MFQYYIPCHVKCVLLDLFYAITSCHTTYTVYFITYNMNNTIQMYSNIERCSARLKLRTKFELLFFGRFKHFYTHLYVVKGTKNMAGR